MGGHLAVPATEGSGVSLITLDIMKLKQLITLTFDKHEKAEEKHTNFQEAITFINLTRGK